MDPYMLKALEQARRAADAGEVPVGAVLVRNGEIIASAHNLCESEKDATAHAEMLAIRSASAELSTWRLCDCTLYVTMEPCPMCAGAILNARIPRVVFGVRDSAKGAFGSVMDLRNYPIGSKPEVICDCGKEEGLELLKNFFGSKRGSRTGF